MDLKISRSHYEIRSLSFPFGDSEAVNPGWDPGNRHLKAPQVTAARNPPPPPMKHCPKVAHRVVAECLRALVTSPDIVLNPPILKSSICPISLGQVYLSIAHSPLPGALIQLTHLPICPDNSTSALFLFEEGYFTCQLIAAE